MKRIVLKKDLPLDGGARLVAGASVKVSDGDATSLIGAGYAVDFADHPASKQKAKKKAKPSGDNG